MDNFAVNAVGYSPLGDAEKQRLKNQSRGYYRFDKAAIDEATEGKSGLTVLDLGCADGDLTRSRFFDERFSKVIGVDVSAAAIASARSDDKFRFCVLDLQSDFAQPLNRIFCDNGVEKCDLIFGACVLHHLASPYKTLKILRPFLKEGGKIIVRSPDDGGKRCYPHDELLTEILQKYDSLACCDRFNFRKLYSTLSAAGYTDVRIRYKQSDTCGKDISARNNMFDIGFGFRLNALKKMNPSPDRDRLIDAINELKIAFSDDDFWYSNTSYIAIAGA